MAIRELTAAFLDAMDCNVIVLDWHFFAYNVYFLAVKRVPYVGKDLGKFLVWLFSQFGGDFKKLHLVGFSLGAHVVGNAGRYMGNRTARITGLDPAKPKWKKNPNALNKTDAIYVEIIHTDGGVFGLMDPIGDADFYPNGGTEPQPGCLLSACSHRRAWQLMEASIRRNSFVGRECRSVDEAKHQACHGKPLLMGNAFVNKTGSGIYGLDAKLCIKED